MNAPTTPMTGPADPAPEDNTPLENARAPDDETTREDETRTRRLLAKLRRTLARVPFADTLLAAHFAALDRQTPAHVKAILVAAIAYFLMPVDLIPDFIAGLGFSDDAAVLATAVQALAPYIRDDHRAEAERLLQRLAD